MEIVRDETLARDETLPVSDSVAAKLDQAVDKTELEELRQAQSNVIPFKRAPVPVPDAPRPKIKKSLTQYVTRIHNEFLDTVASEKDLRVALARSDNSKAQALLASLLDPRKAKIPTAQLLRISGLSSLDLLDILRDHYIGSGLQEYMKGFKEIAQDTVEDAKSSSRECPKCSGEGVIQPKPSSSNAKDSIPRFNEPKKCTLCSGTGLVRKAGDPEARKLIAKSLKIIQSGSGPQVSVAINNNHRTFECVIDQVEKQENRNRRKTDEIIDVKPESAS